ncbi:MAG: dihydrolipoyllysine-residue acetyltransferase [Sulfuritalea sp.]|nr:dihydrolipoyllysine-residue acetyltransferase [Sulfuritalea sp.]
MAQIIEVKVPDIGDFKDVPIIELLVKVGDQVSAEDSLITLESDKATMDVPSPVSGVVTELKLKVGDAVSEGTLVALVEVADQAKLMRSGIHADGAGDTVAPGSAATPEAAATLAAPVAAAAATASVVEVRVPDIGDFKDVPIIELLVKVGDEVKAEDSLMTLESDKATMDIPSPVSGVVTELKVKVGDKVAEGVVLALVKLGDGGTAMPGATTSQTPVSAPATAPATSRPVVASVTVDSGASDYRPGDAELISAQPRVSMPTPADRLHGPVAHASPSVRAFARELGVDVAKVAGTGPKGRILQADVQAYVKGVIRGAAAPIAAAASAGGASLGGLDLLPWPKIDFAKFGEIEVKPLSRIQKISGANLSRNWVMIPAVTYHEDADITELEAFRVQINKENEKGGDKSAAKLTMLAFLIKACVKALQKYPAFNASIDGDNLVLKKYFNIGFAADTPNGLMVPVIKNADSKGVFELARESGELARQAREGKLKPGDMQGACFTISSLGGIGGTYFAPIVNAPEVAILGVNKSAMKPVWDGKAFVPRLTLPLSLTADHRVIDGALATRFNVYLAQLLSDMRRSML